MAIKQVAVIGAGVMGAGIAAQIANAGVPVLLLDIVPDGATDRNMLAGKAVEKMLAAQPSPFMHADNARHVTTGNLEDDLDKLSSCDWIIEVVLEDLTVKQATYKKIIAHRKAGSIVSSNTSTIPLHRLVDGLGDEFARDFLITHFFNPPRFMRLLELVTSDKTRADAVDTIRDFCDVRLGKGVVACHDTPGFIANRLGVFWMQAGLKAALAHGVAVPDADAIMGRPAGIPKTGLFGLLDLVGIDLMPHLAESLLSTLPPDDAYRALYEEYPFLPQMIAAGYTGRKGKGGFYRMAKTAGGGKEKQVLALHRDRFDESHYSAADKAAPAAVAAAQAGGLRALVQSDDPGGRFAWDTLAPTLCYAASLVGVIADDIAAIDEAMRLGYNWAQGPFEMIDALGPQWFAGELRARGMAVPELLEAVGDGTFYRVQNGVRQYFGTDQAYHDIRRADGVLLLADLKRAREPILQNASASVWDIGDGVLCFESHSKMNTMDADIFKLLNDTAALIENDGSPHKALVIYNEGPAFSAGANLGMARVLIDEEKWDALYEFIALGQRTYLRLKFAPFPVVAAPTGLALGGGCEIVLHATQVQAHAELVIGLVETAVGLIPAWGGCKEMLLRQRARDPHSDMATIVARAFGIIAPASKATSAAEARHMGYLRDSDGITMNRDRLLFDAKQAALRLLPGYTATAPVTDLVLPGPAGKKNLDDAVAAQHKEGKATDYDRIVLGHLAAVLTGGNAADGVRHQTEEEIVALELAEFMHLLKNEGTVARIDHMLKTGKPLRN